MHAEDFTFGAHPTGAGALVVGPFVLTDASEGDDEEWCEAVRTALPKSTITKRTVALEQILSFGCEMLFMAPGQPDKFGCGARIYCRSI